MNRIQSTSGPAEIDEKTYWYFLEVLPPRFMRDSSVSPKARTPPALLGTRPADSSPDNSAGSKTKHFGRLAGIGAYRVRPLSPERGAVTLLFATGNPSTASPRFQYYMGLLPAPFARG